MSCEQHEALDRMFQSETEPFTKRILKALSNWWHPPYGFWVPSRNNFYITGGTTYNRAELFSLLLAGRKPDKITDQSRQIIQHANHVVFEAMLMLDDGDPTFEPQVRPFLDTIN